MLCSQLKKLPKFSDRRKEIAAIYDKVFSEMPELQVQREIPESDTTRHLYVLRLHLEKLTCTHRQFFDALYAENVCPQVHYLPVYWHSYYEKLGYQKGLCPNAEAFYESSMSIPLYYSLTDEEVQDVIHAVKKVVAYYRK
jgi:dTDP-4-amino-4,6-dideoxygalactose transaminase